MDKLLYRTWLNAEDKMNSEADSVSLWDLWNKTKFYKKVEKGELTSEEVAKENHKNKLAYQVCVFNEEHTEFPYASVEIVPMNDGILVVFLDFAGREYLSYSFEEVNDDRLLFLSEVWHYHYPGETTTQEDYRLHYVFNQDGNISYRKYDEVNKKTEDYEGKEPLDVSGLYEPYPEFGHYEGVTKLERDLPVDFSS